MLIAGPAVKSNWYASNEPTISKILPKQTRNVSRIAVVTEMTIVVYIRQIARLTINQQETQ
jgi:hypothetical protein